MNNELEILGEIKSGGSERVRETVQVLNEGCDEVFHLPGFHNGEITFCGFVDVQYREFDGILPTCPICLRDWNEIQEIVNPQLQSENAQLKAEVERLRKALKDMLWLFDRDLPPTSIGKRTCNEAKELIEEDKDGE